MARIGQLAAIMFTDIQGYTALMQQNEQQAIQVREKHRLIFNATTKKFNGKILQYYGDGTLSIFDSAVDAVECGIEMQIAFQKDPSIPIRIGIHTGDIILNEEEIIGDGVNIASRIESLAVPGSVFISEKVYDEIKNQKSINVIKLSRFKLKNVEKPIEVYALSNKGLVVPNLNDLKDRISPTPTLTKPERSIAVLAFENMSGDPTQEYFSDGISEEILNALGQVNQLKVAGRTSAFSFKGKNEDIRNIGEKLNVKMVLEGSVRKAGNQVRITTQLINTEDGFHIWSETYDRKLDDIFAIQEDIAGRIVDKLKIQIQDDPKRKPKNTKAYELLLKGSYFLKRGYEGKKKAMTYFKKAVELDAGFARAHAFIGEAYLYYAGINIMSTKEAYSKARKAAQKAIDLNELEPHAHKVLAYIHLFHDWDWEATRYEYNKAIQYGLPQQNEFITYYHIFLNKDFNRAISISKQILETDPLHVGCFWQLGICYFFARRFEKALDCCNNALEIDENFSDAHHLKGTLLGYMGKYEEAICSLERALEITKNEGLANFDLIEIMIQMGKKDEALKKIESLEFMDPGDAAHLYTMLGMYDEAILWLEKGYRERSVMMITLKHGWFWDPIRDDPRFIKIYNKMNF